MVKHILAAAAAALLVSGTAASAQEPPAPVAPGLDKAPAAISDPFDQMLAARRVAEFARRRHDPEAMLVAARMLREVPFRDKAGEGTGASAAFTPQGLFNEARALANGNPQLLTEIRVSEAAGARGVMSSIFGAGLVRVVQDLNGRSIYGFPIQAKGGEMLRIGAIGDVSTHMAMRLKDGSGKVLCEDAGDYAPVCSVKPVGTAALKVEIVNQGSNPTRAVILSN